MQNMIHQWFQVGKHKLHSGDILRFTPRKVNFLSFPQSFPYQNFVKAGFFSFESSHGII